MAYYQNDEVNRAVKLRMANLHPKDIAQSMNRTKAAIDRLLSSEKKKRNLTYPKLLHIDIKWSCARIEDVAQQTRHKKQKDIALELNVSASMISQLMAKRAIMIREANI